MQKALPELCAAVGTLPDLFAANLRTVLRIRVAAIATRISARKLNEGISQLPNRLSRSPVPSAQVLETNSYSVWPLALRGVVAESGMAVPHVLTQDRGSCEHGHRKNGHRNAG